MNACRLSTAESRDSRTSCRQTCRSWSPPRRLAKKFVTSFFTARRRFLAFARATEPSGYFVATSARDLLDSTTYFVIHHVRQRPASDTSRGIRCCVLFRDKRRAGESHACRNPTLSPLSIQIAWSVRALTLLHAVFCGVVHVRVIGERFTFTSRTIAIHRPSVGMRPSWSQRCVICTRLVAHLALRQVLFRLELLLLSRIAFQWNRNPVSQCPPTNSRFIVRFHATGRT